MQGIIEAIDNIENCRWVGFEEEQPMKIYKRETPTNEESAMIQYHISHLCFLSVVDNSIYSKEYIWKVLNTEFKYLKEIQKFIPNISSHLIGSVLFAMASLCDNPEEQDNMIVEAREHFKSREECLARSLVRFAKSIKNRSDYENHFLAEACSLYISCLQDPMKQQVFQYNYKLIDAFTEAICMLNEAYPNNGTFLFNYMQMFDKVLGPVIMNLDKDHLHADLYAIRVLMLEMFCKTRQIPFYCDIKKHAVDIMKDLKETYLKNDMFEKRLEELNIHVKNLENDYHPMEQVKTEGWPWSKFHYFENDERYLQGLQYVKENKQKVVEFLFEKIKNVSTYRDMLHRTIQYLEMDLENDVDIKKVCEAYHDNSNK